MESEKNRFTIIPKGKETEAINLDLDPFIQHGHVIEVTGKTQSRSASDGEWPGSADGWRPMELFHYFTPPLPAGEAVITVTAQNAKGGVNTQQKKIIIQ